MFELNAWDSLHIFWNYYCIHVQFCLLHFILHTLICIFVNELWLFVIAFQSLKVFMKCFSVVCGSEKEIFVYSLRRHDRTGGSRNHTGSGFSFSQDFIFLIIIMIMIWPKKEEEEDFWFEFPDSHSVFSELRFALKKKDEFYMKNKMSFSQKRFCFLGLRKMRWLDKKMGYWLSEIEMGQMISTDSDRQIILRDAYRLGGSMGFRWQFCQSAIAIWFDPDVNNN